MTEHQATPRKVTSSAPASPGFPGGLSDEASPLRLTSDGPLTILTMNSPPTNLFDMAMCHAWVAVVDWLTTHPPRALLIQANGPIVSAGMDVRIFTEVWAEDAEAFWARQLRVVQALEQLPCPTVFAAHSLTLTVAFELALACDLIVATSSARFGLVERKVGFTPAMGGTQRLAERAGPSRARELVMTGDLYRGSTLAQWGVVNALFETATFHDDANVFAMRLAAGPTRAHVATKHVVRSFLSGGVIAADAVLTQTAAQVLRTEDHHRAVAAFLEHGPDHATRFHGR